MLVNEPTYLDDGAIGFFVGVASSRSRGCGIVIRNTENHQFLCWMGCSFGSNTWALLLALLGPSQICTT